MSFLNIDWSWGTALISGILSFFLGTFFKGFFSEMGKDSYKYFFKGGKEEQKRDEKIQLILELFKTNSQKSSHLLTTKDIRDELFPNEELSIVEDYLHELSTRDSRVELKSTKDSRSWLYRG